jgi:tetratricopeptide (TPR) repeat protein
MRILKIASIIAVAACVSFLLADFMHGAPAAPTAFEADLARIDRDIAAVSNSLARTPDAQQQMRLAFLRYVHASLTGSFPEFRQAETEIDRAVQQYGPNEDLVLLRANLNFKLHRLGGTRHDLDMIPYTKDTQADALEADMALQQGKYDEARKGYESIIRADPTWDNLARLAYLEFKSGNTTEADKLYLQSQDEISAKEMRSYAWVELQRGIIDYDYGRYLQALAHYRLANRAYSGYWVIEEHIAQVLDTMGRTDESVALYQEIIRKTGNPEFVSTLAHIIDRKDHAQADALYRQADGMFDQWFALYPEAATGHIIQHYLWKRDADPRLLTLAEQNYQLRPNAESKLLLAKAWLKLNNSSEARKVMEDIVNTTPWRTPEISRLLQQVKG